MQELELIREIVREAGRKLPVSLIKSGQIQQKEGHQNFVTVYDELIQDYLESEFHKHWPEYRFIAEEQDELVALDSAPAFIVDPIDGTSNFIHGLPISAISVALAKDGEVVLGVVYNPFMDEMYWATRGCGAFLNGEPIHCPDLPLERTLFCVGMSPYYSELMERTIQLMQKLQPLVTDLRRFGAAALDLCYIASGRQGGFCEFRLQPWDFAAGMLIAREAGAKVTTLSGEEPPLDRPTALLAAGPEAYHTFVEKIGYDP